MIVTPVNIDAFPGGSDLVSLHPELLAAVAARYSRSQDGLQAILSKVLGMDAAKAVDSVMEYIDYGHASIGGMVPLAIFMDGISMRLAYTVFNQCQCGDGQESSSRYLRFDTGGVLHNEDTAKIRGYERYMDMYFTLYRDVVAFWERYAEKYPESLRVPEGAKPAVVARYKRNFVFDRARYCLPATTLTNVFLIQSAKEWAALARFLTSHFEAEFRALGQELIATLQKLAPRFVKHATPQDSMRQFIVEESKFLREGSLPAYFTLVSDYDGEDASCARVTASRGSIDWPEYVLKHRDNRYGPIGAIAKNTNVEMTIKKIAFGDIRDLNRHRTGFRTISGPVSGFYGALEQVGEDREWQLLDALLDRATYMLDEVATDYTPQEQNLLSALGWTYNWVHNTTLDKLIYEIELRTGPGAHFRYAKHMHDVAEYCYTHSILPRHGIIEGRGEPE